MTALNRNFRFLSAFAGPFVFSIPTGHFRSSLRSRAVDGAGRPLPWYTYPAIDFLRQLDFSNSTVLEFGGGQSTLWWSERAKSVTCLEANEAWCGELRKKANGRVTIHHVTSPASSAQAVANDQFDVIIVDDGSGVGPGGRLDNAKTAFARIKPDGLIVVDNSDADYCAPIAKAASDAGFSRIDFVGFLPGSARRHCTSILLKELSPLLSLSKPPRVA